MSENQLVFVGYKMVSKSARFFYMFKPKECVQGQPFDLILDFRNVSKEKFEGGLCKIRIEGSLIYNYQADVPPIKPREVESVKFLDIALAELGFLAFKLSIETTNEKRVICRTLKGEDASTRVYPLMLASREELYQKYAVVIALFFSVLASILTAINVIVALFR